ncbi:hypothetical protein DFQ26_001956 [Actinomortierella ambigua]|nr:hypothetical protein DFQ26_001956 [Actinomortierella ambigua]
MFCQTATSIASLSKAFTAAAVGELVAHGKANWLTPVNEYIPEFKSKDPSLTAEINLIDVLSHRTGYPLLDYHWFNRTESRAELIKQLRHVDPVAPLRTQWSYNNVMFSLAGEAAGRIDGKSWEEVVRDRILTPAGMTNTGFSIKTLLTRPNHALPFRSKSFEAAQRGETEMFAPDTRKSPDAPAGDMYSNVIDMAKWAKIMLRQGQLNGKQVLRKETVEAVTTGRMVVGRAAYGLGWMMEDYKGHRMVYHSGGYVGYISYMTLFPDDDLAVVVLSNTASSSITSFLHFYLADYIFDLPKTKDWLFANVVESDKTYYQYQKIEVLEWFFPPQIPNKPPTRKLEDFAGDWTHPYGTPFSFFVDDKGNLAYKGYSTKGTLDHYHYDSFRIRVPDVSLPMSGLLTFITGNTGLVEQLQVVIAGNPLLYTRAPRT